VGYWDSGEGEGGRDERLGRVVIVGRVGWEVRTEGPVNERWLDGVSSPPDPPSCLCLTDSASDELSAHWTGRH
jgi:hypothetical protein